VCEGFVPRTCEGDRSFKTCERAIEEVVMRACRDRLRLTLRFVGHHDGSQIRGLVVRC